MIWPCWHLHWKSTRPCNVLSLKVTYSRVTWSCCFRSCCFFGRGREECAFFLPKTTGDNSGAVGFQNSQIFVAWIWSLNLMIFYWSFWSFHCVAMVAIFCKFASQQLLSVILWLYIETKTNMWQRFFFVFQSTNQNMFCSMKASPLILPHTVYTCFFDDSPSTKTWEDI